MGGRLDRRKLLTLGLGVSLLILFSVLATLNAFNNRFLNPSTTLEILLFTGLTALAFLLFVGILVLLTRNLLKLYADQRSRVLGSRLRTRMLWGAILISLVPIAFMVTFSYGLMNRAVDRWFSQPVNEMRDDSTRIALELSQYAAANARAEAESIAASLPPEPVAGARSQPAKRPATASSHDTSRYAHRRATSSSAPRRATPRSVQHDSREAITAVLRQHELTLQNGFAMVFHHGRPVAAFHPPASGTTPALVKSWLPEDATAAAQESVADPFDAPLLAAAQRTDQPILAIAGTDYSLGTAVLPQNSGTVVVGMPVPYGMPATMTRLRAAADTYWTLFRSRRQIRNLYTVLLLMITSLALFASSWLALHLSKQVTRPVEALADAMDLIAAGDYGHRVAASVTDELGDLVRSFNRMASDLEESRTAVEQSTVQLSAANLALEIRRGELETMLETIPNGVATLSPEGRILLANRALSELLDPGGQRPFLGRTLAEVVPPELDEVLDRLIRRSHRMGSATSDFELPSPDGDALQLLITVALLESISPLAGHAREHRGYVVVLENATELLRAQRQSAWKEVARRVAHEIKNPLTPISLSAEQTRRHIDRLGILLDNHALTSPSIATIRRCSEVTSSSVETLRSLVDQFSSLAEFPTAHPQPTDLNATVEKALALFSGRLGSIRIVRDLATDLPLVLADPEALKRALSNLVDNAAEAMQTALFRELRVSTTMLDSGLVELAIADTGSGLTNEMRERLFLPYFSTKQRGTGLGLVIAAKIVQDHQRNHPRVSPISPPVRDSFSNCAPRRTRSTAVRSSIRCCWRPRRRRHLRAHEPRVDRRRRGRDSRVARQHSYRGRLPCHHGRRCGRGTGAHSRRQLRRCAARHLAA